MNLSNLASILPDRYSDRIDDIQNLLENPADSETVRTQAGVLAEHEHSLRDQALRVAEAVDADHDVGDPVPVEDRVDQLADVAGGIAHRDVRQAWLDHFGPDLPDGAEDPTPYMGLDADEWADQQETWAAAYRDQAQADLADVPPRKLAAAHVRSTFGLSLTRFEQEIVEWDRADALEEAFSGPLHRTERVLEAAADAAETNGGGEDAE